MASELLASRTARYDPASVICVAAYAAYFLEEIVLSRTEKLTGLESYLRKEATQLFDTARRWIKYLVQHASPNLASLQALVFGVGA
jgi:hypothetical protein